MMMMRMLQHNSILHEIALEFSPIHKVQPFQSLVARGVVVTALDLRSTGHMFDIRPAALSERPWASRSQTDVPLSPSSVIRYRPEGGYPLRQCAHQF